MHDDDFLAREYPLVQFRRQSEFVYRRKGNEDFGLLSRKAGVGLGKQYPSFAQEDRASCSPGTAERGVKQGFGKTLVANFSRDGPKRVGECL
jgi:hypothetical protein